MPSGPPLPATTVRKGRAYGGTRPLTCRTTVTPDLKRCLEEISKIAAGAGTQPQRHDHQKEPASRRQQGADRSKTYPNPGQTRNAKDHGNDCSEKGKAREVSAWVTSRLKLLQLFSTRGQNINLDHSAKSGGQGCSTSPPRQTSSSSPFSTHPNFKVSSKSSSLHFIWHPCPIPKTSSSLCAPGSSATVKAPALISKGTAARLAASRRPLLPATRDTSRLRFRRSHRPLSQQSPTVHHCQERLPLQGPSALIQITPATDDVPL
jgi:hypothetical protein